MILALLGGGGFRVPLVFRTLLADRTDGRVTQVRLHDTDGVRLAAMEKILVAMAEAVPDAPRIMICSELADAVRGADFVFSAIRVGGTKGRAADERIARELGILGQETTGFGGISYALRGLPVALDIARTLADVNPEAWLINFTNPAGIVTEASREILGDRVIGICDSPIGLARRVLGSLETAGHVPAGTALDVGVGGGDVRLDYAGLNHLGWLQGLQVRGEDVLPRLLERPDLLESFEEGRLFGAEWLRTLGSIPNEYLHYYYFARETVEADGRSEATRGVFLEQQQDGFYRAADGVVPAEAALLWERTRQRREETYMASNREAAGVAERDEEDLEAGGYDRVALAIMHAIAHDRPAQLVLNVANRGTLEHLPEDAVIEVPCLVDAAGPRPLPVSPLPAHALGLVQTVKHVERTVIRAVTESRRDLAIEALALHPLVDGVGVARRAFDLSRAEFPELVALR
ncbi:6-phospho-beta-glucosidase [Brachybacterium vulturis]|uniref:6-phospho-beta-glucosidase n=1 Tax=Brachybacterium vulturis TaxID=2017484 RepID=A0A291GJW3_9MICO|nr:6-phospho-beta-glucosidase [Brachybacterium vulturis]ATG50487.1 6-phospho-beta-glucosidase [Brachybacterium vulturis]